MVCTELCGGVVYLLGHLGGCLPRCLAKLHVWTSSVCGSAQVPHRAGELVSGRHLVSGSLDLLDGVTVYGRFCFL